MRKPFFGIAILLSSLAIVLLGWNHIFELRFEEPRRAIVAWEMLENGNFIRPTIHNWTYYNKPPFFNWVLMAFTSLFGSFSEWVLRFPSNLALLGIIPLFYAVAKNYLSKPTALLIGVCTVTSSEIFFHSTIFAGEIDLFFLFLSAAQTLAIFHFYQKQQRFLLFTTSYLLAAFGVLTKGLPSMAFQGLTLLVWFVANGQWKVLFKWQHFVGIGIFASILGGYFYLYSLEDDVLAFAANLFTEASKRTALENVWWKSAVSFLSFPLLVLQLLLPWSVLVVFIFKKSLWQTIKNNPFLWFSTLFILANLPLYWLSPGTRARYLFLFFPFCYAIILHCFEENSTKENRLNRFFDGFWQVIIGILILAAFVLPFIPFTSIVSFIWVRAALLIVLFSVIFFMYRSQKNRMNRLLLVVMIFIVGRLGYNMVFMPAQAVASKSMIYRELSTEILAITKEEAVHFHDEILRMKNEVKIGPINLGTYALERPPFFHYQLPYYLCKANGKLMQYDAELQPNTFYLIPLEIAQMKNMTVFKSFYATKKKDKLWALAKL